MFVNSARYFCQQAPASSTFTFLQVADIVFYVA